MPDAERRRGSAILIACCLLGACASLGDTSPSRLCDNATGERQGLFHTFWHDQGDACITLLPDGGYAVQWDLRSAGSNLVAGRGWREGLTDRTIVYRAESFDPGSNGYLTLYGWSRQPLIEYYVVDSWGSAFTPPGPEAVPLGEIESDGGTYRIYRTVRTEQPSIEGRMTFQQYWSVRTERRAIGSEQRITFANHVAGWRRAGLELGRMDYQVLATEGFGSRGSAQVMVREE